ncbi:MAG: hybrid sensor histidine kinase/response regulator [Prochloraceae cyanobacterium]|nr:hybrid sensor histidine kinase/response regulator [Prochloraceae cyanobacterium]
MVSDFQTQESYQFFTEEAVELLQELEQGLLLLRENHNIATVNTLMRIAHSLKGGSACVGLDDIQEIAGYLEHIFEIIKPEDTDLDLELEDLLLKAYDCLRSPLIAEIETSHSDAKPAILKIQGIAAQIETKLQSKSQKKADVTDFLFAEEVAEGIDRLAVILQNHNEIDKLEGLKAQVEIFKGLGKIARLDGFVAIAETTLSALKANPNSLQKIGELALDNFRTARANILAGNRGSEIAVSSILIDLCSKEKENLARSEQVNSSANKSIKNIDLVPDPPQKTTVLTKETTAESSEEAKDTNTNDNNSVPALASLRLGVRMDLDRLKLLNNLVAELVTQDNRYLLEHKQQVESIEVIKELYDRLKQINHNFHSCLHQLNLSQQKNNKITSCFLDLSENKQDRKLGSKQCSYPKLEDLMENVAEELAHLGECIQDISLSNQGFHNILKTRQKTLKQLQTNLLDARMVPIGDLLNKFPRMVRDLSVKENKQIKLELRGTKTLIDRAFLEKLYDPLVHIIRNAIAHGIESPEVRKATGKPAEGTIKISCSYSGNQILIDIEDDGKGIDWEKVRNSIVENNLVPQQEAAAFSQQQLSQYLFSSGFSTAAEVTHLAGRGMGLSAVKLKINHLKGKLKVVSEPQKGTNFQIRLPLTLTIVKLLVFSADKDLLAIPVDSIISIAIASNQEIKNNGEKSFYFWQREKIPVYSHNILSTYYYPHTVDTTKPLKGGQDWQKSGKTPLIILGHREQKIAFKIDEILMEQDLVLKPFNSAVTPPHTLCGCTILGDGRLIPVLDASALVEKWIQNSQSRSFSKPSTPVFDFKPLPTILIADDSLTMRQTLSITLSKAGYRVIQARDGLEAIEHLKQQPGIKAVISDVEMPRMNGMELLTRARQLMGESLPIVMLTSRSSQRYKDLAIQLGATEYLTKPYVDKDLLDVISKIY